MLRGGLAGPNYDGASVLDTSHKLAQAGVNARMLVDCSHDNSGKDHRRQYDVVREVARQLREDESSVLGVMVESHLVAGRQSMAPKSELRYGQSITDACVDLETWTIGSRAVRCRMLLMAPSPSRMTMWS